jgi:hypothetical protein
VRAPAALTEVKDLGMATPGSVEPTTKPSESPRIADVQAPAVLTKAADHLATATPEPASRPTTWSSARSFFGAYEQAGASSSLPHVRRSTRTHHRVRWVQTVPPRNRRARVSI